MWNQIAAFIDTLNDENHSFVKGKAVDHGKRRNRLDQTDVWDSRVHRYNDDYSERTVCLSATNYSLEFYQVLFATNGLAYI